MGSIAQQILKNMGSQIEVYITAASPDRQTGLFKFWTQLDAHGLDQVEQQAEQFQYIAQEASSPPPDTLEEGNLCIAKYLEDGRWYRARIDSVTGNDVIAFFIDYGNTEIIPRSLVRMKESVGDAVFAIPAQATECVLAGVAAIMQHRNIKMGTHGYLKNVLVDHTLTGEPQQLTNDGLEMKLFTRSGDSIAERFILDEYGVRRGPGVTIPAATPVQKMMPRGFTQMTLSVGSRENLYVSNVVSLGQFWVQQASKSQDLDNLMDNIGAQYDGLSQREKALELSQEGSACITTFSEDGVNYRAKVTKIQGPNQCTVQFVDFGNSEVKDKVSLKAITDDLLHYPAIAIECLLSGINAKSCSAKAVERFEELTAEKELCGKVVGMSGSTCCMLLIDPQGEENADIVSVLVKEGLASRDAEQFNRLTLPTASRVDANSASCTGSGDAATAKSYIDPTICRGSEVVVEIIAVRGTDDFSCQLMEEAEAFNVMMDKLQSDYSTAPSAVMKLPSVGQACCVRFSEDDCWYRARVVSIQGNQVRVQYVDYGNGEVIDASKLKELKAEYLALPLQCIDCSLDGMPTLGAEAEKAVNWLDKRTEENLIASITGVRDGKYLVVLKSEETGTILNEEIQKILPRQTNEMTPPRPKPHQEDSRLVQLTPPRGQSQSTTNSTSVADLGFWSEVKLGARETDVYISHVEDPNKLFCQLVSQAGELNVLMDNIHTKCVESKLKQLQHACIGTPCVAQFSEDNNWYRGVIKDQKPGFYRVCFVDYGNEEDVPLEKVREITADLMTLPQQAASCCLSGWDLTWKEVQVNDHLKKLTAEIEKFRIMVRESKGMSVVQIKWQGKDMLQELKKVRESIPKEVKQPPKAATPPRQREKPIDTTPPFSIPSAVESVKVGNPILMAASVVKGPTKFFCQLCSQYDQLQQLSAEMNNHYSTSNPSKETLTPAVPGAFCAAQSSSDGAWYRAKILHAKIPGKFKVRFVDYGDDDVLAVASLRNLLPKFRSLPIQAIKCRLSGVMQKFEAVVLDQEVMVMVKAKQDGKLQIEYQDDSIRTKVQEVFGAVVQQAPSTSQGVNQQVQPTPQQGYTKQGMLEGKDQDIYVTHVDNLQKLYVQMCSRSDEIDTLQQKLKTTYSSNTSGTPSSTAVGTPCCAKFSEDGDWYRAVITGQPSPGKVVVQFVDFGNSEEQSASDLRPLKPEFLQQTTAAVECKLKDVGSTSPDLANEFLDLTSDKSLKCQLHGREEPYEVDFPELQAELKKWQQADVQQLRSLLESFPAPKMLAKGTKEEVYITSVTSPANFWCQVAQQEGTLNKLMDSIDTHYNSLSPGEGLIMASLDVGMACIAQFAEDGCWYRAKITEVHPDSCTVTFIDYGNSDKVSRSLIMDIKEDFLIVEQQALLCSLGGVSPVGSSWTKEACDSFGALTGDKKLLAEVIQIDPITSSHQITLLDLGMSLGQGLIEKGQAKSVPSATKAIRFASESDELPDQLTGFKTLDIVKGSTEKVYVAVVNSLHEFYCQVAARATEDLEPLSEKLQADAPMLDNIKAESIQGVQCIAQFSDDEQWYRASVIAEKDDSVDVFFVDYGNRESIPRSQIKVMTDDFSILPAQAVKCTLAHIPESSACEDTAVAEFENLVLESEALMAEFVGRRGNTWIIQLLIDGQPVARSLGIELMDKISESPDSKLKLLSRPSLSYTWPTLKPRQVIEVFVTAVNSPEDFWCQLANSEDDLNIVMDNIQSLVNPMGDNLRSLDLHLQPGHICLAQCAQDGYWYRSEVIEVTGAFIKVLFVDTGKTESVPSAKVRLIEADFLDLQRQSFRCQLVGISPREQSWEKDATNAFKKLTSDHSLMADILKVERGSEGAVLNVLMTLHDGSTLVSDLLTEKGHAQGVELPEYAEEEIENFVDASIIQTPCWEEPKYKQSMIPSGERQEEENEDFVDASIIQTPCWEGPKYKQSKLPSGERQEVVILSVISPSEFYSRVADLEQIGIPSQIRTEVERHIGEMIGQSRLVPAIGMPCVAKCEDGTWKRVEILDVFLNDQVKVFLVDEAQAQVIPIDNLQLITSTLLELPVQAMKFSLGAAPSGSNWSEVDTSAFKDLVDGKTLHAELVDERVHLFDEDESVLQILVQKADDRIANLLAEKSVKMPEVVDVDVSNAVEESDGTQPEIPTVAEDFFITDINLPDSFKQAFESLDLQPNLEVTLCLVTVDSPDEITCQITHKEQKVLDIEQRMTELYGEESETPEKTNWLPKVGEPCAAKHSEYEDWYRATVVSVDQETGVEVCYADYGGTDRVLFESIRELNEELRQLPAQAMRFRLNKPLMPFTKWNKKTKAIIEGQDTEQDLHAKVLEVQERILVVELTKEDHTFLTHLVDQSQMGSLDNEDEDDDRDVEFFDAVDQASETDDIYEVSDIDDALMSIAAENEASEKTGGDIESNVVEIIENLFERAAEQAMAYQIPPEVKSEDVSGGTTEVYPHGKIDENDSETQYASIPKALSGSKMISMKDILDQFVDHTLQNLNKGEKVDNENEQTEEQGKDRDVAEEEGEGMLSDGGGDEEEIQEALNGEIGDDESAVAISEINGNEEICAVINTSSIETEEDHVETPQESKEGNGNIEDTSQEVSDSEETKNDQSWANARDSVSDGHEKEEQTSEEVDSIFPGEPQRKEATEASKVDSSAELVAREDSTADSKTKPLTEEDYHDSSAKEDLAVDMTPSEDSVADTVTTQQIDKDQKPDDIDSAEDDLAVEVTSSEDLVEDNVAAQKIDEDQKPYDIDSATGDLAVEVTSREDLVEDNAAAQKIDEDQKPDDIDSAKDDLAVEVTLSEDLVDDNAAAQKIYEDQKPDYIESAKDDLAEEVTSSEDLVEDSAAAQKIDEDQKPDDIDSAEDDLAVEVTSSGYLVEDIAAAAQKIYEDQKPDDIDPAEDDLAVEVTSSEALLEDNAAAQQIDEDQKPDDINSAKDDLAVEVTSSEDLVEDNADAQKIDEDQKPDDIDSAKDDLVLEVTSREDLVEDNAAAQKIDEDQKPYDIDSAEDDLAVEVTSSEDLVDDNAAAQKIDEDQKQGDIDSAKNDSAVEVTSSEDLVEDNANAQKIDEDQNPYDIDSAEDDLAVEVTSSEDLVEDNAAAQKIDEDQKPDDINSAKDDLAVEVTSSEDLVEDNADAQKIDEDQKPYDIDSAEDDLAVEVTSSEDLVEDNAAAEKIDEDQKQGDNDSAKKDLAGEVAATEDSVANNVAATQKNDDQDSAKEDLAGEVAASENSVVNNVAETQKNDNQMQDHQTSAQVDSDVEVAASENTDEDIAAQQMQEEEVPDKQASAQVDSAAQQTAGDDLVSEVGYEHVDSADEVGTIEDVVDDDASESHQPVTESRASTQVDSAAGMATSEEADHDNESQQQVDKFLDVEIQK